MRRLLLLLVPLVAVLALPATAPAKGLPGEEDEPTQVTWLTVPDGSKPGGGGWLAQMRISGKVASHPQVVVLDQHTSKLTTLAAVPDGAGIWAARVRFPHAGDYAIWAAHYDPRDPWRIHEIGPAVHVDAPPAPVDGGGSFPWWIPVLAAAALAAFGASRLRTGLRLRHAG